MSKDEILRVRVDADTVEKLHKLGHELEQLRPGLDYSMSNLVRAAIQNFVEPPKKDPQKIELRIPENTSDSDLVEFWDALATVEAQSSQPGIAALVGVVTEGFMMRYISALKNIKLSKYSKGKAFAEKEN